MSSASGPSMSGSQRLAIRPDCLVLLRLLNQLVPEVLTVVEYGDQRLQIVAKERTSITYGGTVSVAIPEEAIHVFDPETGARVVDVDG